MKAQKRARSGTQLKFLPASSKSFGGTLMKTRKGRLGARPLSTRETMHLVLRSSKATGAWSFWQAENARKIRKIVEKFSHRYGIKVFKLANVGNHLHFHIKLTNRHTYKPFIRALTAAIAMAVTGASRWRPLRKQAKDRFWDYRPFTRVIQSYKALITLKDYILINELEGAGVNRINARLMIAYERDRWRR